MDYNLNTYKSWPVQKKADFVRAELTKEFPRPKTPLFHKNAFELLIATILSPQTPDNTTNKVTPKLFRKYPDVESLSVAKYEDVLEIVRPINYNKTKAKRITQVANILIKDFDGQVPSSFDDLITLPGVGRKVANVVVCEWFASPIDFRGSVAKPEDEKLVDRKDKRTAQCSGFVVDTHVLRVSKRLGLTKNTNPDKVEKDLMELFPKKEWRPMSLRFIFHGRFRCTAKNPRCIEHAIWGKICSCVDSQK